MDDRGRQGWARDPFRLHESRYFSAGRPTKLVRDGNVESYDDPPSDTHEPADATPAAPTSSVDGLERTTAAVPPSHTAAVPSQMGSAPRYAGAKGWYAPYVPQDPYVPQGPRATPGSDAGQAPSGSGVPGRPGPGPDSAPGPPRRPRAGLFVAAALVIAVAVFASVRLVNGSGSTNNPNRGPTTSSVGFVTRSAQRTLAAHTVDLTLSGAMQNVGKTVTIDGTGEFNFDTNAMAADIRVHSPSGLLDEKEVLVNRNSYFAISLNGKGLTKLPGGRHWIRTPVKQSEAANLVGSDPLSSLSVLEQQGSTVRPLGSKTIDGVICIGYAVTPSLQAMITATREEDAKLGVSSAITEQDVRQVRNMPPPTITIWSDAQGLVRELSINLPVNVQGGPRTGDLVMDFSHFGAPVSITAPPPSDTVSDPSDLGY